MKFYPSVNMNCAMNNDFGFVPADYSRQTGLAPYTLFSVQDQGCTGRIEYSRICSSRSGFFVYPGSGGGL